MYQPNSNQSEEQKPTPRWETAILIFSFIAIWIWWLARQNAYKAQTDFHMAWNGVLLVTIGLLVWVFVRRLKRTLTAMKSIQPGQRNARGRN
jgi:hypothetical protein